MEAAMRLMDYHTHSTCSPDAKHCIADLAQAAVIRGLSEICVTDHYDIDGIDGVGPDDTYDVREYAGQLEYARALVRDRLVLVSGVELGEAAHDPGKARALLDAYPYDFVLGSLHNLRGTDDFFALRYESVAACQPLIERYIQELIEMARRGDFDAVGHLTYPLRYMIGKYRLPVDFRPFEDGLRALFTLLAQSGKGLEVNTSGLRGALKDTMPDLWCLKLFRRCGGEIVTVGSDAHTIQDIGSHIADGYRLLSAAGFTHVASFRQRKPQMMHISL